MKKCLAVRRRPIGDAPGRVNLLGEHTDYNDGYVLPIAIPQRTRVALHRSLADRFTVYAANLDRTVTFDWKAPPTDGFATYVFGCLFEARAEGIDVPPLDIHLSSNVPIGVGLSSSAALEVATLRALRTLLNVQLDDVRLAQLAQRAEVHACGRALRNHGSDGRQFGGHRSKRFFSTRERCSDAWFRFRPTRQCWCSIRVSSVRWRAAHSINVAKSAKKPQGDSACRRYATSARMKLRRLDTLDEPLRSRARHVVTENARVLQAVECGDPVEFGALMNASHASLRDDFDVSVPALDRLVALLQAQPEVYGARLTGAGFGGACVALCRPSAVARVATQALDEYAAEGFSGALLVPPCEAS